MIALLEFVPDKHSMLEHAMYHRRSMRGYTGASLELEQVARLLWAAQGVNARGKRSTPSAGGLYPLEVYLVAGRVTGLEPAVYKYQISEYSLIKHIEGDMRTNLWEVGLRQDCIKNASAVIVIAAVHNRVTKKYGKRGHRYINMEAGCAAQNVALQATALGLGSVFVGAFRDGKVKAELQMEEDEWPMVIMPIGRI